MLKHLSISNYAIIENLEIGFNKGFTVITGETGAGKSILLGAFSLILGQRAEASILNDKLKKCIVEGTFEFEKEKFLDFFKKNDLDFENPNIIRREITTSGKSRAFINDTPVSLALLKELALELIDIHSQHQTLQVQESKFQLRVVDAYAEIDEEVIVYKSNFIEYQKNKQQLNELISAANTANSDTDYLLFQTKEIESLKLKTNEKEEIQSELDIINNAEEIKSVLVSTSQSLIDSDKNILVQLKSITNSFSKIINCSEDYDSIKKRLDSTLLELEDIANDISRLNDDFSFDPDSFNFLTERLSAIYSIEQKHNISSTKEILELLQELKNKISHIDSYEEKIKEQENIVKQQKLELDSLSKNISNKRQNCFKDLCAKITLSLIDLGMPNAVFKIQHQLLPEINDSGIDQICFLFTSNKGVDLKELSKTASGGELSRLMLTIKSILAKNKNLATVIFDEVDTGVSGDIADKMANIMKKMSKNIQIISITHLPQVAAKGEFHFKIYKENRNNKTNTLLIDLKNEERVEELAKMLSGEKLTAAARENARTLLNS